MTKQKIITTTPNQQILWSMVYLNTIPIRNLSHRIKNRKRENRQPVEPKSVKQHKATKIKLKKNCGGQLSRSYCLGVVFYLKKNRMARRHALFDKKNVAPCIADVPFFISSNDP
jgi:hypothetical protein